MPRRIALVALVLLIALPVTAQAVVRSKTVTDPKGDVDRTASEPVGAWKSVDIHQVTYSSDTATGTKQIYAKIRLRNVVPRNRKRYQQYYLDVYRGKKYLGAFYGSSTGGGLTATRGCGDKHITLDRKSGFVAMRFAASCVGGGRNLRFAVLARYAAAGYIRSSDTVPKSAAMNY